MRTEIVKYVHDPKDPEVFLGVVVAIGPDQVGYAKTHEKDRGKWDRKLGLRIARSRAAAKFGTRRRVEAHIPDYFHGPYHEMVVRSRAEMGAALDSTSQKSS